MSNIKTFLYYLSFFFIIFTTGCKEETLSVVTLSEPIQSENTIVLNWKPENIKGFRYYSILRATDGQHYFPINNTDSVGSDAYNQNITSFTDASFPFVESIYYKIQVFGDEIISSKNMIIYIRKPFSFEQPITSAFIIPETRKVLIYTGYDNTKMYLYNIETGLIENEVSIHNEVTGSQMGYGKYNGNYEFYFYDSWNDKITIYDVLTMKQVGVLSMSASYPYIISDKNGNIFIFSSYSSSNVTIINREQLLKTNYYYSSSFLSLKYCMEKNTIKAICSTKFVEFNLDVHGNMTPFSTRDIPYYDYNQFIENSELIYRGNSGSRKIIDTNTWQEFTLKDENNAYYDFTILYSKNNVLYAARSNRIYCYRLPDLRLFKMINVRFSPVRFLSDEHKLYFFGAYNGQNILDNILLVQ